MSVVRLMARTIAHHFGWGHAGCASADRAPRKRGSACLRVTILEDRLAPAVLTVNSLADGPISAAGSQLTLREAIALVDSDGMAADSSGNSLAAAKASQIDTAIPFGVNDVIQFAPNLLGSQQQLIVLGDGSLLLDQNVTIRGPGASQLAVSGNNQSTVFEVAAGAAVRISGLTVEAGAATGAAGGGGIINGGTLTLTDSIITDSTAALGDGGGIFNTGRLKLVDSTVSANQAANDGGLDNFGTLALIDSTVSGNTAAGGNGGLANYGGKLALIDSSVSGNMALGAGGLGNYDNGSARLRDSIVSDNTAEGAGGIFNTATLKLTDSTVSDNRAVQGNGGGIINSGSLTLVDSTVSGNTASNVGGLGNYDSGATTLLNSSVSGNTTSGAGGILNIAASIGSRNEALFDASLFSTVPLAQTENVVSTSAISNETRGGETGAQTCAAGVLVAELADTKTDAGAGSSAGVVSHDSVDDGDALAQVDNARSDRMASDGIISGDSTAKESPAARTIIHSAAADVDSARTEPDAAESNQAERFDILDREGFDEQEPGLLADWTIGDLAAGVVLLLPWLHNGGCPFAEPSARLQAALERVEEEA